MVWWMGKQQLWQSGIVSLDGKWKVIEILVRIKPDERICCGKGIP